MSFSDYAKNRGTSGSKPSNSSNPSSNSNSNSNNIKVNSNNSNSNINNNINNNVNKNLSSSSSSGSNNSINSNNSNSYKSSNSTSNSSNSNNNNRGGGTDGVEYGLKENSLKLSALHKENNSLLLDSRKAAHESIGIGVATMEALQSQGETLDEAEDTLDRTEYIARKATRALRDMTWGGMVYNWFTSDPVLQNKKLDPTAARNPRRLSQLNSSSDNNNDNSDSNDNINNSSNNSSSNGGGGGASKGALFAGSEVKKEDPYDAHLDDLSKALEQMHSISVAMSGSLDDQQATVKRLDRKSGVVHNSLISLSVRATRISRGSGGDSWKTIGIIEMLDIESCRYIAVDSHNDNTSLVLTHKHDASCQFYVYARGDTTANDNFDIITLQNVKTLRFIRITLTGNIAVTGESPGYPEELLLGLEGNKPTGMLLLRRNWGAGGWLKCPYGGSDDLTKLDDSEDLILNDTSTGIHDMDNTLLVLTKWRERVRRIHEEEE